jgi:regulator of replication initiation timing
MPSRDASSPPDAGRDGPRSSDPPNNDREEVQNLRAEVQRLRDRVARLQKENRQLRQEATIVRLYDDLASTAEANDKEESRAQAVHDLYRSLPERLTIRDFFARANRAGFEGEAAREVFIRLLRSEQLSQAGSHLTKPDEASSGCDASTDALES